MRLLPLILATLLGIVSVSAVAQERAIVDASAPTDLSITIYRDPDRSEGEKLNSRWPRGFAMISETRTVNLPAGVSTIRFDGVAEGMVAVSAIVTGLPEGTIEKNRNAELLSPAALVNGALGNRVTITRTNPATGTPKSESAFVRTRADGGLVLQTQDGFEAVRCSGLPEKLTFNGVPRGLSAKPVYSVNTTSSQGGTFEIVLTYIAWGFDWEANYVGTLGNVQDKRKKGGEFGMHWLSWLTLVNNNGQSFDNAKLQVVAGKLNIDSDFDSLSDPPVAERLRLTCYPIGSTAAGSPVDYPVYAPPAPAMMMEMSDRAIVVTATRSKEKNFESAAGVAVITAEEEDLGDLKLYRVPERVNVSAKGIKQVAFLNQDGVKARYIYVAECSPWDWDDEPDFEPAGMRLVTKNEEKKGLGMALPQGGMAVFEPSSRGDQLVADTDLRDYARGQDVELEIGESAQVQIACARANEKDIDETGRKWNDMRASVTNANPHSIIMRLNLGWAADWEFKFPRHKTRIKDGMRIVEIMIPANSDRNFDWKIRQPKGS